MKFEKLMKCSAEEAFDVLANSLVLEIQRDTHRKNIALKDLKKGYSYTKRMRASKKAVLDTKVTIEEFNRPEFYKASFDNTQGTNYVSYTFSPVDEYQCICKYEETYVGKKTLNKLNFKLVGWILVLTKKSKIKKTLTLVQKFAVENRNKKSSEEQA